MGKKIEQVKKEPQFVNPDPVTLILSVPQATFWLTSSFAPGWFADALQEANSGQGHNARRREIVFAVCFAESYLSEWVRDKVLNRQFEKLKQYFPEGDKRGVIDKWKKIPKDLRKDGVLSSVPDLGQKYWEDFLSLVDMRNGLVHANSSLPYSPQHTEDQMPKPSLTELRQIPAGWATNVVITLVKQLHDTVGTRPPDWLIEPKQEQNKP